MLRPTLPRWAVTAALLAALSAPAPVWAGDCAPPRTYVVQRGDTLNKIARRFGTTVSALVTLNHLPDLNRIYAGQMLAVSAGVDCPPSNPSVTETTIHVVQRGETLYRIALNYGTTVSAIAAANGIANPARIFAGQRLVIPSGASPPASAPLAGLRLSPNPPEQGRTLFVYVPADGLSAVTGSYGDWPIHFFREGDQWIGLTGIYALARPDSYTLRLELTDQNGSASTYTQPLTLADGGYARESITLTPDKSQLLDPQLTVPERERIAAMVAPTTPTRYWQGPMQPPAAGRTTSPFGIRRSYNGGPYSSFHAGQDFSAGGGRDILAPAAGVVVLAEPLTVRGNATLIDHGWGVYSGFWHQSEILVHVGDVVQAGQLIGRIGDTGLATGPHLHWELFVGGVQVDPLQWTRR